MKFITLWNLAIVTAAIDLYGITPALKQQYIRTNERLFEQRMMEKYPELNRK